MTHRVVIVGGGFGGIHTIQRLRRAPVEITLIDRRNFHLFQPLTYQVATGALSPGEVAYPLRSIFKSAPNVHVLLADVTGFDLESRQVLLADVPGVEAAPPAVSYDTLIVAAGSSYSYFGHEHWREYAAEVKTLESATAVRAQILRAFEAAEMMPDTEARTAEMTFVVVGAGPTGVEMSGQIAELARDTLRHDFRVIDSRNARVIMVDALDRVLTGFPPSLSRRAHRSLQNLGVTIRLDHTVVDIDDDSVTVSAKDGKTERIATRTVIWAAGVTASGLGQQLSELSGAEVDKAGRLTVEPDLTLPGHPEVIALGDMVRVRAVGSEPVTYPGVAPVAIQQGRYAAGLVAARLAGRTTAPFHYIDKGNIATIGRGRAVAQVKFLKLSGLPAWLVWLGVHLWYLIGFQNRLLVFIKWSVSFFTHGRSARIITYQPVPRGGALSAAGTAAGTGARSAEDASAGDAG
ncbi:MAG TPA: NAD(P)/FAD-dependent oxidoreductase [Solirubrobacteraceae bacterium]|nr:NAD(P)/FAD-dependent oxidoreductase [Solirubrobacteraceae bacterium]